MKKFAYIKEFHALIPSSFYEGEDIDKDSIISNDSVKVVYTDNLNEEFDVNIVLTLLKNAMKSSEPKKSDTDFYLSAELHEVMTEAGMNRKIASIDEVWDYLTVFYCMDYVKWRWGDVPTKVRSVSKEGKAFRQSLSRLWWWAEMTIDRSSDDPYRLTRAKSVTQDSIQFATDTIMPTNNKCLLPVLECIIENNLGSKDVQKFFAKARALNATRKIEFMSESEIKNSFNELIVFGE